jgi:hypothetical protein
MYSKISIQLFIVCLCNATESVVFKCVMLYSDVAHTLLLELMGYICLSMYLTGNDNFQKTGTRLIVSSL